MGKKNIAQLWYTWSDIGFEHENTGFRVRAASPELQELQGEQYRDFTWYTRYKLPEGVLPNIEPERIPASLSLLETVQGYMLIHKVYVGLDGYGRPGNYFVHLLWLPEYISAAHAIKLWNSTFWQRHDVSRQEQPPAGLNALSIGEIVQQETPQHFDISRVQDVLRQSIVAFLAPNGQQQRMILRGHAEQVAAVIWGLTQSIPASLLPCLTFTTYDNDIEHNNATIIGTMSNKDVLNPESSFLAQEFLTSPRLYGTYLDKDIEDFAEFAINSLLASTPGSSTNLTNLVSNGEKDSSIQAFMERFREHEQALQQQASLYKGQDEQATYRGPEESGQALPNEAITSQPYTHDSPISRFVAKKRPLSPLAIGVLTLLLLTNILNTIITSHLAANPAPAYSQTAVGSKPSPANTTQTQALLVYATSEQTGEEGTNITFTIVLQNIGQTTWSDQAGYKLICHDQTDKDCASAQRSSFLNKPSIAQGEVGVLTVSLSAQFADPNTPDKDKHTITVDFVDRKQQILAQISLDYMVTQKPG